MRHQAAINEMQFGFMLVRESTDSVFISKGLLKNYQKKRIYLTFVYFEKAFERVPREVSPEI